MLYWIKNNLPKTLFRRTLLIIILPLVLAQGITAHIFFERHVGTLTRRLAKTIVQDMRYTINHYEAIETIPEKEEFLSEIDRYFHLKVKVKQNAIVDFKSNSEDLNTATYVLKEALASSFDTVTYIENLPQAELRISLQRPQGVFQFIVSEKRLYSTTARIFILWMIGSTFVLFTIAILFLRNQIRPISRLARAAEALGKGRDVRDFKPRGAHEVRQASIAFLKMKDRLSSQIQQRTEMLAGVSHDLRTPLTRINLALALIQDKIKTKANQKYFDEIDHNLKDMDHMVETYLAFAKGEEAEISKPVNISALIDELTLQTRREHKNFIVLNKINKKFDMPLKKNAIKRALINLINNGYQYGDSVTLYVEKWAEHLIFYIDDNGPGIPKTEYENVFKPFYRAQQNQNLDTDHIGLGLPIAKDIIASHGGEISLTQSAQKGLRVIIKLPL